jgi:hypothetical protein
MTRKPKWCNRMWVCIMSNSVKSWEPSSINGCYCSLVKSAHCIRPPKRLSTSSKKGLKRVTLDLFGRRKFFRSDCNSAMKTSSWTAFTQTIRAVVSSVTVMSSRDFSLRREYFRKRGIRSVVRTRFQYELNLEASTVTIHVRRIKCFWSSVFDGLCILQVIQVGLDNPILLAVAYFNDFLRVFIRFGHLCNTLDQVLWFLL